ncbi:MAG: DUF4468 domain-containing protein [Bacteroidota bacterium]
MNRWLIVLFFLLTTSVVLAQNEKDTLVYKMPVIDGKLIYKDSIELKGRKKTMMDSVAKKWFFSYFKYYKKDTSSRDKGLSGIILDKAAVEFRMSTTSVALVKYDFYLIFTLQVNCADGYYTYKIFDIFFTPKSSLFRSVGYYQQSPEYLLGLYKQKHLGFGPAINMGRKKIREYLTNTDNGIRACIASLNKAMAN